MTTPSGIDWIALSNKLTQKFRAVTRQELFDIFLSISQEPNVQMAAWKACEKIVKQGET